MLLLSLACTGPKPAITAKTVKTVTADINRKQNTNTGFNSCKTENITRAFYNIKQDGKTIGVEVRSIYPYKGTMGEEKIYLSHIVKRYKMHNVELDRFIIRAQRFLKEEGTFLRGSTISINEASTRLSLVGFNGAGWDKIDETLNSVNSSISKNPHPLPLSGNEKTGFQFNLFLKSLSQKKILPDLIRYYTPTMNTPVLLGFMPNKKGTLLWNKKIHKGVWVTAVRYNTDRVIKKIFVDEKTDEILQEIFPAIHQVKTLTNRALLHTKAYASPFRGLFSKNYLGLPQISTSAKYKISAIAKLYTKDFKFLDQPKNQQLKQIDDHTLMLTVHKGAPDGSTPPDDSDLQPSKYINSDSIIIKNALKFLKTGGTRGNLPNFRKENAIPVAARASRIESQDFWNNPAQAAGLIREYVHALLPVKRHTHTMKNSLAALNDGLGDCTEHSVLFAALMRAAKIPTRLVSGMYLAHGGSWEFHMWNEYWDNGIWKSIDTTLKNDSEPGAHYIALSLGVSNFKDHRDNIAFFLDRSFSGLQFDLIEAGANGEALYLVKSNPAVPTGNDAVMFQAITLMKRGNDKKALALVTKNYNPDSAPVNMELLLAELQFRNKKYSDTLKTIHYLKNKTSLKQNRLMLDTLNFKVSLAAKNMTMAKKQLKILEKTSGSDNPEYILQKAAYLFTKKEPETALKLIESILLNYPDNAQLLAAYGQYTAELIKNGVLPANSKTAETANNRIEKALYNTYYADPDIIKSAVKFYISTGAFMLAQDYIEHCQIMKPDDEELKILKNMIITELKKCDQNQPNAFKK
jgi:hypothetical protein